MDESLKQALEKIQLYGGKILDIESLKVKCRFNHIFILTSGSWCAECGKDKNMTSIMEEVNKELCDLDRDLQAFQIDSFGIAQLVCSDGHINGHDVDELPTQCVDCTKPSAEWDNETIISDYSEPFLDTDDVCEDEEETDYGWRHRQVVTGSCRNNVDETDEDNGDETDEDNVDETDEDNVDETDEDNVDETDEEDIHGDGSNWFDSFDQMRANDSLQYSDDEKIDQMDCPEDPDIKSLLVLEDEPNEFADYGDIADLAPINYSTEKKIYRESNLTYNEALPVTIPIFPLDTGAPTYSICVRNMPIRELHYIRTNTEHRFANFIG
jgi:hypothetical protein